LQLSRAETALSRSSETRRSCLSPIMHVPRYVYILTVNLLFLRFNSSSTPIRTRWSVKRSRSRSPTITQSSLAPAKMPRTLVGLPDLAFDFTAYVLQVCSLRAPVNTSVMSSAAVVPNMTVVPPWLNKRNTASSIILGALTVHVSDSILY
jgi:hypothetical protein